MKQLYKREPSIVTTKPSSTTKEVLLFIQQISPFLVGSNPPSNSSKAASVEQIWKKFAILYASMTSNVYQISTEKDPANREAPEDEVGRRSSTVLVELKI